jgi:hypothetical protein
MARWISSRTVNSFPWMMMGAIVGIIECGLYVALEAAPAEPAAGGAACGAGALAASSVTARIEEAMRKDRKCCGMVRIRIVVARVSSGERPL